jgi:hypothetical protein
MGLWFVGWLGWADVGRARELIFQVWGLAGITYLVLTRQVEGMAALGLFAVGAGLTQIPAFLRSREGEKDAQRAAEKVTG